MPLASPPSVIERVLIAIEHGHLLDQKHLRFYVRTPTAFGFDANVQITSLNDFYRHIIATGDLNLTRAQRLARWLLDSAESAFDVCDADLWAALDDQETFDKIYERSTLLQTLVETTREAQ